MFEIRMTDAARDDMVEIDRYLRDELANPQAADAFVENVERTFRTLEELPQVFPPCRDARLRIYRKASVGGYLFLYRVDESSCVVHVIRFFHQLQDYVDLI